MSEARLQISFNFTTSEIASVAALNSINKELENLCNQKKATILALSKHLPSAMFVSLLWKLHDNSSIYMLVNVSL
jgi:hypothetical protein